MGVRDRYDLNPIGPYPLADPDLNMSGAVGARETAIRRKGIAPQASWRELRALQGLETARLLVILPQGVEHFGPHMAMGVVESDGEDNHTRGYGPQEVLHAPALDADRPCRWARGRPRTVVREL
jgi:hypothetical protein